MTSAWARPTRKDSSNPMINEAGTFMMDAFRAFYVETTRQLAVATGPEVPDAPAEEPPEHGIRTALTLALEGIDDHLAGSVTEQEKSLFEEARYVMVALADDLLIRLDWPGRQAWVKSPLEAHVFATYEAGELFFARLDEYLRKERKRPAPADLVYVYLMALCLGFRGKYAENGAPRGPGPDPVEKLCADLRQNLQRLSPGATRPPTEMCPEAVAHTIRDRPPARLPALRQPLLVALALAVVSLALSAVVWPGEVAHVVESLRRIEVLR